MRHRIPSTSCQLTLPTARGKSRWRDGIAPFTPAWRPDHPLVSRRRCTDTRPSGVSFSVRSSFILSASVLIARPHRLATTASAMGGSCKGGFPTDDHLHGPAHLPRPRSHGGVVHSTSSAHSVDRRCFIRDVHGLCGLLSARLLQHRPTQPAPSPHPLTRRRPALWHFLRRRPPSTSSCAPGRILYPSCIARALLVALAPALPRLCTRPRP